MILLWRGHGGKGLGEKVKGKRQVRQSRSGAKLKAGDGKSDKLAVAGKTTERQCTSAGKTHSSVRWNKPASVWDCASLDEYDTAKGLENRYEQTRQIRRDFHTWPRKAWKKIAGAVKANRGFGRPGQRLGRYQRPTACD